MLNLLPSTRVFVCTRPTDMRKGFDGLSALTVEVVKQNPLSGHLFVFRNKSGDKLKVLYWGGDGLILWYKRLERGTFELPKGTEVGVEISATELNLLIDGVALDSARRKRFSLAKAA
ncbi:MAG: IS66 family insertion sequence element accessory protein TnpB [Terriglobia bacterium]